MVRLKGFKKLTPINEALEFFFRKLNPKKLEPEKISVHEALDRVLWRDIIAERDVPPFDRSAVDGYAVRAQDTFNASATKPKTLTISKSNSIQKNEAIQVWTGNAIPKGADAVVMLEYAKRSNNKIEVLTSVTPGQNISKKGEDVKTGQIAVKAGIFLKPQHLGLITALGIPHVDVTRKPKVGILATGNELVELGDKLGNGQVFDVNRIILSMLCRKIGAQPIDLGIARDNYKEIADKIREKIEDLDLILTTGGTSVGGSDIVPTTINRLGSPGVIVHGVAMRPGMPTALAVIKDKPILLLSGNPVAAMIGFEVFAKPLILKLLGVNEFFGVRVKANLTRHVAGVLGQRVFVRVKLFEKDSTLWAEPVGVKGSGVLSTMTEADGYIVIPEEREGLSENEKVTVHIFSF
jgi:molybdopterin molybdotransferase